MDPEDSVIMMLTFKMMPLGFKFSGVDCSYRTFSLRLLRKLLILDLFLICTFHQSFICCQNGFLSGYTHVHLKNGSAELDAWNT